MVMRTDFAPAERATEVELKRQVMSVKAFAALRELYDPLDDCIVLLNEQRQIVYANRRILELLGVARPEEELYGKRPGEALNCTHAACSEGGCGTTKACSHCGAAISILTALQTGERSAAVCRVLTTRGEALTLKVCTALLTIEQQAYVLFTMRDVSDAHRRRELERIFFHDILNSAGGIRGLSELLWEISDTHEETKQYAGLILSTSSSLVDEIVSQRDLLAAESGELKIHDTTFPINELIQAVGDVYRNHTVAKDKRLRITPGPDGADMTADATLLRRVLGNMVKNALEACRPGEEVTLSYALKDGGRVAFAVHNPAVMPEAIQLQMFQRSFSTKGADRGIGTYSMKLISERYLNGVVSFVSKTGEGTTFFAEYPRGDSARQVAVDANNKREAP